MLTPFWFGYAKGACVGCAIGGGVWAAMGWPFMALLSVAISAFFLREVLGHLRALPMEEP